MSGTRKFWIVLTGLVLGFLLAAGAFVLAYRAQLTGEYVAVYSSFAGLVGIGLGAFVAGNFGEHWAKTRPGTPPAGGEG